MYVAKHTSIVYEVQGMEPCTVLCLEIKETEYPAPEKNLSDTVICWNRQVVGNLNR